MIKVIYPPSSAENAMQEDIQGLAKEICEECLKLLREPEKSQATPAAKVLNAFLATTRLSLYIWRTEFEADTNCYE